MIRQNSRAVQASEQVYRALVGAYPAGFRAEYGDLMLQAFRDCCREAVRQGSWMALVNVWLLTFGDYIVSLIQEHAHGGAHMSREKFTTLSGWGLLVAFFILLAGDYANNRPNFNPYNAGSQALDRLLNPVTGEWLLWAGFILYAVGMTGLYLRFWPQTTHMSRPGMARAALLVAVIGGWGTLVFPWLFGAIEGEWGWFALLFSYAAMATGAGLFAIGALRDGLVHRLLGQAAALNLVFPVVLIANLAFIAVTGGEGLGDIWGALLMMVIPGIGMTALGLALVRPAQTVTV